MTFEIHDKRQIHCRLLGHSVRFEYCRKGADDRPCGKICDCWHETFDVVAFLREHLTDAELQRLTEPPKEKVTALVELIQQARQRVRGAGDRGGIAPD